MRKTIIDITRATILEGNINDDLWPELVLVITYIKNSYLIRVFNNLSPYKAYFYKQPSFIYLSILDCTIYIVLYTEEHLIKTEKWALQLLKKTLISYNKYTIYRVHIKKQNKVFQVKDFCIFEDFKAKTSTKLPDYFNDLSIFQSFYYNDNNNE